MDGLNGQVKFIYILINKIECKKIENMEYLKFNEWWVFLIITNCQSIFNDCQYGLEKMAP